MENRQKLKNSVLKITNLFEQKTISLVKLLLQGEIISDAQNNISSDKTGQRKSLRLLKQANIILGIENNLPQREIQSYTNRTGRIDISLKQEFLFKRPLLVEWKSTFEKKYIFPIDSKLKLITFGYLITPPGVNSQIWHQDNPSRNVLSYLTVFIGLTNSTKQNGTLQIIEKKNQKDERKYITWKSGEGVIFSGNLVHRGTANRSKETRYLFYLIYSLKKKDPNIFLINS